MIPNPLTEIHAIICSINDLISITGFVKYMMVIMVGGLNNGTAAPHFVLQPSDSRS